MKKLPLYSLLIAASLVGLQPLSAQTQTTTLLSPEAQIAAAQANYDAWDQPSQPIGPNHRTTVRTTKTGPRQIVEIGTGLNYWNGLRWVPSNPTFVPVANGFLAGQLQDPVQLAGDLYTTNAVTIRTPEGIMLGSTPVAVALYDAASGNFAVIATITNCQATLVESNQVLYPDAFSGDVCASVVYTISQGTFHQDVVFTGPLDPADYGFPRDTTRIQIITEFYGAPMPDELDRPLYVEGNANVRAKMASPDLIDEQLGFGRFVMTTGKAYVTPSTDNPDGFEALVAKEYKTVGDGTYLFESIPYNLIASALSSLPPCHPSFGSTKIKSTKGYANIPHPGNKPHAGPLMAQASHAPAHGVVVDYVANISGTMSGVTIFKGDTTYLVSSAVVCNGPTTIEGGAVFKYKPGVSIALNSTLTCKTSQYRPAIFTAVDDDAVGDSMTNVVNSGYTGHISSSGYANPAIYAPNSMNFTGFRIRYAQEAIRVYGSSGFSWSVTHAQFVNCIKGIEIQGGGSGSGSSPNNFNVNNCLFSRVSQPILGTSQGGTVNLYALLANATVDNASALGTSSCGVNLYIQSTNSIYVSVSTTGTVTAASGKVNAFFNDGHTFGSSQIALPYSPFLTFGAGNYYLTNLSGTQTSGITNSLPATLLKDFAKRTTYPPSVIAGTTLTTNLVLVPQVYRDTNVASLGYHYDPIDYAFGNVYVSNASVTMSGGVAIATFGTNNSSYGLGFGVGSTFSSIGAPNVPDWIVLFNTVQEGTNLNWQRLTNSVTGELFGATPAPSIFTRFTLWSVLAQDAAQFYAPTNTGPIGFQDSEFHGGTLLSYRPTINLTNCLLERVYANLTTSDGNSPYIRNNLFFGGIFNYAPNVTNSFVKDNLFDMTVIPNNSSIYTTYNGGYNAYVMNNSCLLPVHANDVYIMTNAPNYQAGPLGLYYQTNTSVLINAGQNATADQVGLYHYTVCTNLVNGLEVKETNSVVDIGYHYVAGNNIGNPIDSNSDGIPDYIQFANGLGFVTPTNRQNFIITPTNILLTVANYFGPVTNVQFFLNDTNSLGTVAATNGLATLLWTNATAGTWKLTATNNATPALFATIFITNNAMPMVAIVSPTNVQSFLEVTNVTLSATASDSDGTISSVEFYTFTNLIGTAIPVGTNYNFTWNSRVTGFYPVTAVATDNRGASTVSAITVFKVNPTNPPPFVQITFPTNNAVFADGSDITITAVAYGTNGGGSVTNVEFFVNGASVGNDPNAPYSVSECCWRPGTYTLNAKATDNFGSSSVSTNITIVIAQEADTGTGFWDAEFGFGVVNSFWDVPHDETMAIGIGPNNVVYVAPYTAGNYTKMSTDGISWSTGSFPQPDGYNNSYWFILPDGTNVYFARPNALEYGGLDVARWDGSQTYEVGDGLDGGFGDVRVIAKIGGDIYVGGDFTSAGSGGDENNNVQYIAKLDAVNNKWLPVGNGLSDPGFGLAGVYAIAAIGNDIYIGGSFINAGGNTNANYVARLVSGTWTNLGTGISVPDDDYSSYDEPVTALAACSTNLYVGGQFQEVGGYTNANGIAIWDTAKWHTMNGGVGPNPLYSDGSALINTISVRGNHVFVGGFFTNVLNGTDNVPASSIAMATWSEADQKWTWSDLDGGLFQPYNFGNGTVYQSRIVPGNTPSSFDLLITGYFDKAGQTPIKSPGIARWRVGYPQPPALPSVSITNPADYTYYESTPSDIELVATATSIYTNIARVDFYVDGGEVGYDPTMGANVFSNDWSPGSLTGNHLIKAIATDVTGLQGVSWPIWIKIADSSAPANTVTAVNDLYVVMDGDPPASLNVLTNDSTTTGHKLRVLGAGLMPEASTTVGTVQPSFDGSSVVFTPMPHKYGTGFFVYTVTDGVSTNSAQLTVKVREIPLVLFQNNSGTMVATNSTIGINGAMFDYDTTFTNFALYVNGSLLQHFTPTSINYQSYPTNFFFPFNQAAVSPQSSYAFFTNNWSTNLPGFYNFQAVVSDQYGYTATSSPVTIIVTNNSTATNLLTAVITNVPVSYTALGTPIFTVVQNGLFDLKGMARDSNTGDAVTYQLLLHPSGQDDTTIANVTPQPRDVNGFHQGGDIGGDLGTNDFTGVPNGVYDLELIVHGGGAQTNYLAGIQLDSQLKIGQFSFSEQDLVLPVNGIPITITRTYNSLNGINSDFGYNWSFVLNDMDVQLDDQRQDVTIGSDTALWADDESSDGGLPKIVNIRTGGGWDVTLTLPDGRRAAFKFDYDGVWPNLYAKWDSPPGVTAKLSMVGNNELVFGFSGASVPTWADSQFITGMAPLENQDIQGWILQTQDGKKYHITRGTPNYVVILDPANPGLPMSVRAYGTPKLTSIEQRSGETIVIGDNSIYHQDTNGISRQVNIVRDAQGRITAIYDPNGTNGPAAVQYIYNQDTGNLIQVLKLVDRNAGTYVTNFYDYNNPAFPHYITGIINGDGVPAVRNFYDNSGRLIEVDDANGNKTTFIHNLTNNTEIVIDRLGNTNALVYDLHGNFIIQTNQLGQITTMAFDGNNNKTNTVVYLGTQPYATNSSVFDGNNLLLASTDPLGNTNGFTYDSYGNVLTSSDAFGHTTVNAYDFSTGNLLRVTDALNHGSTNSYNNGLLVGSVDAVGTVSTNYYDGSDNLIATATLDASGVILSSNTFAYDLDGNRTNSTVWRRVNGSWTGAITAYIYDAQNRVVQTVDPDGGTNTVVYNPVGKQSATIDKLGRVTSYIYDLQNRLIQTKYPDLTTETNGYDANGNRFASANRLNRITTYFYDALNRLTNTTYADGTTSTTVYDGVGRVSQTIDARGTITGFKYDAAGRRLAVTNAVGIAGIQAVSSYGYDANGNQITFTDANTHTTTSVFDALNRQLQVLYPDGTKTGTAYDSAGRRVAQTNQDNIVTWFTFDGVGRLTAVTNALNQATRYRYDEAGNEIAQIDALNRTNIYIYDSMGRRIQHLMPGGQSEGFGYDPGGNLLLSTNFNGAVITNRYDVMNRMTNSSSVNGYTVSFAYSPTGQRTNMIDVSGTTAYSYDNRDRLTNKAVSFAGGPAVSLNYRYDLNGNVTNLWSSTSGGVTNVYQYDPLSRLTNVLANGSAAAGYGYDLAGNLQAVCYGNGVTNLCQYDSLNRLTNDVWKLNASTLATFYYQLGLTGNRTNLSESVNGSSRGYSWQYDTLYRLTNETVSTTAPTGTLGYGYDAVGNRTNRSGSLGSLGAQTLAYNTNDWLNSDTYDNNGNTVASSGNTYQYDVLNHVTNFNSGTVLIGYDGDGNRVKKTKSGTTTYYLLDDRNPSGYVQVLEEYQGSSLNKVYNYGMSLISQRVPSYSTNYFIYDGHGSTRVLTDNGGNVANAFAYDAYGNLVASNAPPQTVYLYCGQQFDSDLGFYYLRSRMDNPNTGRFLTSDSYAGDNDDPLSLHKYLYVCDNPVNMVDPSGQDGTVMELSISGNLAAGLAAFSMAAVYEAKTHALSTLTRAVAIESISMGDSVIETARSAIRAAGKSLRDLIEEAKTQIGQLRNSPVKVIPMPRSIIPGVAAHIASAQSPPTTKPMLLERCSPGQAVLNRAAAIKGISSAGPGYSLDEYPFASSIQGGVGASVAAVPFWENCVQGGIIGACYTIEKITPGTPYYVVVTP